MQSCVSAPVCHPCCRQWLHMRTDPFFDITTYCRWIYCATNRMKGHAHPCMCYKCTARGCLARKHVEMSESDNTQLVTTYSGMHSHSLPAVGSEGSKRDLDCGGRLSSTDGQLTGTCHEITVHGFNMHYRQQAFPWSPNCDSVAVSILA